MRPRSNRNGNQSPVVVGCPGIAAAAGSARPASAWLRRIALFNSPLRFRPLPRSAASRIATRELDAKATISQYYREGNAEPGDPEYRGRSGSAGCAVDFLRCRSRESLVRRVRDRRDSRGTAYHLAAPMRGPGIIPGPPMPHDSRSVCHDAAYELCAAASASRGGARRSTPVLPAREYPRPEHPRDTGTGEWRGLILLDAFAVLALLVLAAVAVVLALRHDAAAVAAYPARPSQSLFLWHSLQSLGATVLTHLPLLLHVSLRLAQSPLLSQWSLLSGMAKHSQAARAALEAGVAIGVRYRSPGRTFWLRCQPWAEAPLSATPPKTVARAPPARRRSASRREGFAATRAFVSASNRRSSMNVSLQIPMRGAQPARRSLTWRGRAERSCETPERPPPLSEVPEEARHRDLLALRRSPPARRFSDSDTT